MRGKGEKEITSNVVNLAILPLNIPLKKGVNTPYFPEANPPLNPLKSTSANEGICARVAVDRSTNIVVSINK